jgi:hypothetical protein
MAISRVPGYSLLSDLDRQGVDLQFTTNSLPLAYLDFANYRLGVNTGAPQQTLEVVGNILVTGNNIYTSGNLEFDVGSYTNYWRTGYFANIYGTVQTAVQPNITTVGNITNLNVTGNLTVGGQSIINTTGNLNASNNQIIWVGSPIQSTEDRKSVV